MGALLDAVMAVSSGLNLDVTLRQIVHAAMELVASASTTPSAPYRFVHAGIDEPTEHGSASDAADLVIDIADNGIGIPDIVARSGLHNLSTRTQVFGGTLTVDRPAGGGTHLIWAAPLP